MRLIVRLLILVICFAFGVVFGLMLQPNDTDEAFLDDEQIREMTVLTVDEWAEAELATLPDDRSTHPIEKMADAFEKITDGFFESVVHVLSAISEKVLS